MPTPFFQSIPVRFGNAGDLTPLTALRRNASTETFFIRATPGKGTAGAQSDQMNIRSNTPSRPGDTGGRTRRNKPRRRNRGDVTEYERTHTLESIEENGRSAKPFLHSLWPRAGG